MVAELAAAVVFVLAYGAEFLHARRVRRIAMLAFGPNEKPAHWTRLAPMLRVVSLTALCWGMTTLMLLDPKVHKAETIDESEMQHLLVVLDVSPSMRLDDAGIEKKQSRMKRMAELMESFFSRVNMHRYKSSVIAVYNGAKPVVKDTKDLDVIRNIMSDLPMHYAFASGETDLFSGLKEAADMAKPWNPRSTLLLLLSDGDTVPSTGMPKMPASVSNALVVGVGDSVKGSFINGRHSKQDVSTLRQIAIRLGGTYHNGNEQHISTEVIKQMAVGATEDSFEKLTHREYALLACLLGGIIYGALPWFLHHFGTAWKPGVPVRKQNQKTRKTRDSKPQLVS